MCLQFGFVILWQKDFGANAALKTLVKLTPGHKVLLEVDHTLLIVSDPQGILVHQL